MQTAAPDIVKITRRKMKTLVHNAEKSAQAVDLQYVSDAQPGIKRMRKGKGFAYFFGNEKVTDAAQLERIKKLVIPPAWRSVWICLHQNGHLQATGLDIKNRKQYKYHPRWNALRNHTKFHHLHHFGSALPAIRLQIEKDLALPGLPPQKVLALVLSLMERTSIRIGSHEYEKLYGSFGLTTLKDRHVNVQGGKMLFSFKGKKGIQHTVTIKSTRLARIVKKCRDIPGKELFQYLDESGQRHSIDSGMVNNYIKQVSGDNFTAKDFRTWAGTVQALIALKELGRPQTQAETKKKIVEALDTVSLHLGNTRAVCKKYYVHPLILALYENNGLEKYYAKLDGIEKDDDKAGLTAEEKLLMKILEKP